MVEVRDPETDETRGEEKEELESVHGGRQRRPLVHSLS